jgi:pilus assembly protein CpaB
MRARSLILIVIALVLAGGTAMLARAWLVAQRPTLAAASPLALPQPAKSVLVTRAAVQRGQILRSEDLAWQPWPDGATDKSYVLLGSRTPESFSGSVARLPLGPGEPVTETKLVKPGDRGFLAAVLRPGMRAISVPITATSGISGFVFPGDFVDILITESLATGSNNGPGQGQLDRRAAETVLHDVRVIGIDQKLEGNPGEAVVGHTATLEVTPKQGEIIELASEIGKLSLSLRSLRPEEGEEAAPQQTAADSEATLEPPTFTLDSEVSPLLAKPRGSGNGGAGPVTILRGGSKSGEAVASQPASKGS